MDISNSTKMVRAGLFTLFMALAPLVTPALAQNSNGANTAQPAGQTTTNINRPAETPRTETRRERDFDFPWGLLGLLGLAGLLRRPKRIVETVEVRDTNPRAEPRRDPDMTNRPDTRP